MKLFVEPVASESIVNEQCSFGYIGVINNAFEMTM